MDTSRFADAAVRLVLASAVTALSACQSAPPAGVMQDCDGLATPCVEVTLRYHQQPQAGGRKIQLLDSRTKELLKECRVCDPKFDRACTADARCQGLEGRLGDAGSVEVFQIHSNPTCYTFCSGGYCTQRCRNP